MGLFPSHCGRAFPWLKKQVAAFPKFIFGCMCLSGRRAIRIQGQPLSAASEETNENTNKAKAMVKISSPTIPHLSLVLEFLYLEQEQHIKKQRHYFANKVPSGQSYGFSSSHVWM